MRSRAAAGTFMNAGYKSVFSMEGGLDSWNGMIADKAPDAGIAYFAAAERPEQLIALAWLMEDGSRRFYSGVISLLSDPHYIDLFQKLTVAEDHHKETLVRIHAGITGNEPDSDFMTAVLPEKKELNIMESNMNVAKALEWAKDKGPADVIEMSMTFEINSYDLYILLSRKLGDDHSRRVFKVLAEEEKQHLTRLTQLFRKTGTG